MKLLRSLLLIVLCCTVLVCQTARAEGEDYLLINLTSYTTPESRKAIEYAKGELQKGRPVIIYLEDSSVLVAAKANARQFKEQQQNLSDLMQKGAIVAVCPHCLKRFEVSDSDLLPGIQVAQIDHQ